MAPANLSQKKEAEFRDFLCFLFRRVGVAIYRLNEFFHKDLPAFAQAMQKADDIIEARPQKKKRKKNAKPLRIYNLKIMKLMAEEMQEKEFVEEPQQLVDFMDISGRLRCASLMAGNLVKAVEKLKIADVSSVHYFLAQWKYFTKLTTDFSVMEFTGSSVPDTLTEVEKKYFAWPVAVRTAAYAAGQVLSRSATILGLPLLPQDPYPVRMKMYGPEFALVVKTDDLLFQRDQDANMSLLTGGKPVKRGFVMPDVSEVEPRVLQPITNKMLFLNFNESMLPKKGNAKKKGKK